MAVTKRDFLIGAAAAPIALSLTAVRATADDAAPSAQFVGVRHLTVGDRVVTAILDGDLGIGAENFSNLSADEAEAFLTAAYLPNAPVPTGVNVYIVRDGARTILIDAGGANAFPSAGKLAGALEPAGVAPEDVDLILVTHLHPDHVGGLITAEGAALFPNAGLRVHEADVAFWSSDANRAAAPDAFKGFFDLATNVLAAYGDKVDPFNADGDVAPGVAAIAMPGHTPGHTGFRVEGGADSLLIWGDIVHVAAFQFPKPAATIGFDVDQPAAAATRAKVFDQAVADRARIAGMHLSFPGVGRVEKASAGGFRFVPEAFTFNL